MHGDYLKRPDLSREKRAADRAIYEMPTEIIWRKSYISNIGEKWFHEEKKNI